MKTFCGKTLEQMHKILNTMCDLEDFCDIDSAEQQEAFDIAIQCVTSVINLMGCKEPTYMFDDDGKDVYK